MSYFSHLNIYPYRKQKTLFIEVVYCNEGRIIFSMLLLSSDAFMQTQGFGEIQRSRMVFPLIAIPVCACSCRLCHFCFVATLISV